MIAYQLQICCDYSKYIKRKFNQSFILLHTFLKQFFHIIRLGDNAKVTRNSQIFHSTVNFTREDNHWWQMIALAAMIRTTTTCFFFVVAIFFHNQTFLRKPTWSPYFVTDYLGTISNKTGGSSLHILVLTSARNILRPSKI